MLSCATLRSCRFVLVFGIGVTVAFCAWPQQGKEVALASAPQLPRRDLYKELPLHFEPAPEGAAIDFIGRAPGYEVGLHSTGAVVRFGKAAEVRVQLAGAHRVSGAGIDELPGKSNYLLGRSARHWRAGVAQYAQVKYPGVWPGVDVIYYGRGRQLEYDFIVAPRADVRAIRLQVRDAQRMTIDGAGDLVVRVAGEELRMHKPAVYQEQGGARQQVAGRYVWRKTGEIGVEVEAYDHTRPLIIDPVLSYSALLDVTEIDAVAVDGEGAIYVTGLVRSTSFPVSPDAARTTRGASNIAAAFVAKLNSAGTGFVYSTYFGGLEGVDQPAALAVDRAGQAYVVGRTRALDFPTTPGAFQTELNGQSNDCFIIKLNAQGTRLVYATLLGGVSPDEARGLALDEAGSAYVSGTTDSFNFPLSPDAPQRNFSGFYGSGFAAKLNPQGSGLIWSTYVGTGVPRITAEQIAVDAAGNAYVTGTGLPNAYVTKIDKEGKSFGYYTRLGYTSSYSSGFGIAVDAQSGAAYVTGDTAIGMQPTAGVVQRDYGGGSTDAFVAKLTPAGEIAYLTYLGGRCSDKGKAIAVDETGNAYLVGETTSDNFPLRYDFGDARSNPLCSSTEQRAFVAKLSPNGSALPFASYYGIGGGQITSLALFKPGQMVIAGRGSPLSAGMLFVFNPALLRSANPLYGAFVTKIDDTVTGQADLAVSLAPNDKFFVGATMIYVLRVTNVGTVPSAGPIRVQLKFDSQVFVNRALGDGWYGTSQFVSNPAVMVYPGSLAPGQEAKLFVDFGAGSGGDPVKATATVSALGDANPANNTASDTTALVRGCFGGSAISLPQLFPAEGGTYSHPVNYPCPGTWQAISNAPWITINSGPATGNGGFSYTVAPNTIGARRDGSIVFAGTGIVITQDFTALATVSAASYGVTLEGRQTAIAQGSIAAFFGPNLATTTEVASGMPLPTELAGTRVKITDSFGRTYDAPLFFVAPTQINYLVPAEVATGYATVAVYSANGRTQTITLPTASVVPGLFSANADGGGPPAGLLLRVKSNGQQSYEPVVDYNPAQQRYVSRAIDFGPDLGAASDQLFLVLFGTGIRNRSSLARASVQSTGSSAGLLYAGPQGGFAGLDQVNVQLNRQMINFGAINLTLYADGEPSNSLSVQFKR